ncbi:hypothetical protein [Kineococcus gynurae]|uniref:Secreted protein n=1 Tax=Kineococcus gynurae TaxID=452979 RepID=A0ABV5LV63_9ACTN
MPLLATVAVAALLVTAVGVTRSAGADPAVELPAMPPGTTTTATTFQVPADGPPQPVRTSLSAVLPASGHAFVVLDCIGPASSTVSVRHRDDRPWSPAAVVDGADHADGACDPTGHRQGYGLVGAPAELVTLDVTGGPVTAVRVVVSDACPCQG